MKTPISKTSVILASNESTVVAEYTPLPRNSNSYQSEAQLEKNFIKDLGELGYEYLPIHCEEDLINNLRKQIEKLNDYTLSDNEWNRFFTEHIANSNEGIKEKSKTIQEDRVKVLRRDDGTSKNIKLIDDKNIHNNSLQVINQYEVDTGKRQNRYDITVLVNGLPLVHIELKRRGVPIREAFNQINRYQRDSFWTDSGLFEYVQIFVISNGTNTKYYSNTTRFNAVKETGRRNKKTKTSNSFEFTSFWADANNKIIPDLVDFTKTFFAKHAILNILTKYCVFTSEDLLLVMRPYQIVATERILNRIDIANNYKKYGTIEGGGYIWHTTGSGKTLTSFKTARLASKLPYIDKVLFVVDRKDLDYQTMREYDRFEKGAANSNTSTLILKRQLEDPNAHIIITTIQKLSTFIKQNEKHDIYNSRIVIIFDECHRSQFGDMHKAITKKFKKYNLFGFTGTPIFAANSFFGRDPNFRTTEQAFGEKLHSYTIVDAINDRNVLPFRIDYIKTMEADEDIEDVKVWDIDRERVYLNPERIRLVTEYILEHFNQKTYRNEKTYVFNVIKNISEVIEAKKQGIINEIKSAQRLSGFNSIFAVSSIEAAKLYYEEFTKQMKENPEKLLKIALIYSYGANEEDPDGIIDEENPEDTSALDYTSRDFLEKAIEDYNKQFNTNFDTSSDKFQNYYKDVSLRMKNKEIDLLIVVNMFLTGFDATTLNTLWVDKNLKMHGLIQAYSRTNRILNSIKTFGNIICFRNLRKRTDAAVALFGDKDASGIVIIRSFNDYYNGYDNKGKHILGYTELIDELVNKYPLSEPQITGESNQKEFITLVGNILKVRNLLLSFDDFQGKEILSDREFQDYLGRYQDLHDEWKKKRENGEIENIDDDVVFVIELIKQIEINIEYILMLIAKFHATQCQDKELKLSIEKAIDSSPTLRSKKTLIENFIGTVNNEDAIEEEWKSYVAKEKEKALTTIIEEENLKPEETKRFIDVSFRDGSVKTTGTDIDKILPPISRFGKGNRKAKKATVIEKILAFFERFWDIG